MRRNRSSRYLFGMILWAIVFATGPTMHAQTPVKPTPSATPSSPPPSLEREFVKNILRDQKAIWTSPFHLERSDLKWVVPSGIGLMALITTDRISGDEIAESDRSLRASRVISYGGSVYGVGAVAGSALGYGIGKYVYNTHHQKSLAASDDTGPASTSRWPAISPEFNRHAHAYGIGLTWSF